MKRAILPALVLGLLFAIPALSQDAENEELLKEIEALKEHSLKQDQKIETLEAYMASTKSQAATLLKKLKFAEKKGYTYPAPHNDARKALLFGLQDFASVASGGSTSARAEPEED